MVRQWVYATMFAYIVITTAASFWARASRSTNFLGDLGDALTVAVWTISTVIPGGLIARWLVVVLIFHRLGRFVALRRFDIPFGFGTASTIFVAIGVAILLLGMLLHFASGILRSEGLGAVSVVPYVVASLYLPLAFIVVELWSFRSYARKAT